jgi:hypothetical protein
MEKEKRRFDYVVPECTSDYYRFVMVTLKDVPAGMCGLDQRRAEMHEAMCSHYGLGIEKTKEITDHLDRVKFGSDGLHRALCEMRRETVCGKTKCGKCGSGNVNDLGKGLYESTVICRVCEAHWWDKWYSKEEWDAWIGSPCGKINKEDSHA